MPGRRAFRHFRVWIWIMNLLCGHFICTYMYIPVDICINIYVIICMFACICTCEYIYICIYIYTHMYIWSPGCREARWA